MTTGYIDLPSMGGGGVGTVTSVGLSLPDIFIVTNSPVTTSGTLTGTFDTQIANTIFAGPTSGSDIIPSFRVLVNADFGSFLSLSITGLNLSGLTASQAIFTDGSKNLVSNAITGTGNVVMSASPTLTGTITAAAASLSGALNMSGLTASQAIFSDGSKNLVSNAITGTGDVVMSAGPTLTGTITAAAANFSGAVAVSSTLKSGNYHIEPLEYDAGNSSTAQTIDWANGSSQKSTLTGSVTYTFSNPVAGGAYVLKVATGAGSFTATWPATVKWAGGTGPTITTTASRVDLISFYWDGTNYFGTFSQNYTP